MRVTAYAVGEIMQQVMAFDDPCEIRPDKVGAWLMDERAAMWDGVCDNERSGDDGVY